MLRRIRIFLSSPGDVAEERAIALQVVDQLRYEPEYKERVVFETVAWEDINSRAPMLATMDPQEAINRGLTTPSRCDIVIVIFWSRIGTPLPFPEYQKPNGEPFQSGTEWEYMNALETARETHRPLIAIYRRMERVMLDPDAEDFDRKMDQYQRVKDFFDAFRDEAGAIRQGHNQHKTPEEFRQFIELDLKFLVNELLKDDLPSDAAEPAEAPPLWEGSPFPGLRAFTPEDAPIFFGRGRETDALVKRVAQQRFVAVVGASGSGKSSLVGAGLLPRLKENAVSSDSVGSKDWVIVRFLPGGDPFVALAAALSVQFPELEGDLADTLRADPSALVQVCAEALRDTPEWAEVLLFIDQFEEIFTLTPAELRQPFFAMLTQIAQAERVRTIVTLRADFYHRCVDWGELARLLEDGQFPLSAPSSVALHEMITRPAERADLAFEDGLAERILADTGSDPGALALMAYTLDELYIACKEIGRLTHAAYDQLGGVQGAIGKRAESAFAALDPEAQAALPRVFRELVEIDDRGVATRRRAPFDPAAREDAEFRLLNALTDARLLVQGHGAGLLPETEVAHEALFRSWARLERWLDEVKSDLYLLQQMRAAARLWQEKEHSRDFLWLGERGRDVQYMLRRLQPKLNNIEQAFSRSEQDHLLAEIDDPMTDHARRSAIGERLHVIGDTRPGVGLIDRLPEIAWCYIPGGEVTLRSESGEMLGTFALEPFYIGKYLVTYAQFQAFIESGGYGSDQWWEGFAWKRREPAEQQYKYASHPRDNVNWYDALAFCRWLTALLPPDRLPSPEHRTICLPTEWEWQQAATGGDPDRRYPWGEVWSPDWSNTSESGLGRTTAVGMYPAGASPTGVLDLSGSLQEWCLNSFDDPQQLALDKSDKRALRGGSWSSNSYGVSIAARDWDFPYGRHEVAGFRIAAVKSPIW